MTAQHRFGLNRPQMAFARMPHKFRAFVGGYGSGKTWVGSAVLCAHAWQFPKVNAGYFAPTHPQIRDIFYPTIEEVAFNMKLTAKIRVTHKEVDLYSAGRYRTTVICRSMENPNSIVGFKIGHALADELDVMAEEKARQAWRKIIARMRYKVDGLRNGIDVTTTPEGFRFVYKQFVQAVRDKPELASLYGIVHASTRDNARNLNSDYIESLLASYPPQIVDAYLDGMFVNMTTGSVYPNFDRVLNHTSATPMRGEPLHVGMDFNVQNMTAIISVIRDDRPFTVAELTGVLDTPAMVEKLLARYPDHAITVYPDASGKARKSVNASESDLTILRSAGFSVRVDESNPAIRDRVLSVNAMLLNGDGDRRWLINTDNCPRLVEALEQQCYDSSGDPDKSSGHDHPPDAAGYFITKRWPIVKRDARVFRIDF